MRTYARPLLAVALTLALEAPLAALRRTLANIGRLPLSVSAPDWDGPSANGAKPIAVCDVRRQINCPLAFCRSSG
jgi:hypothetical protein